MWPSIARDSIICFHYGYNCDTLEEVSQTDVSALTPAVGEQVGDN